MSVAREHIESKGWIIDTYYVHDLGSWKLTLYRPRKEKENLDLPEGSFQPKIRIGHIQTYSSRQVAINRGVKLYSELNA